MRILEDVGVVACHTRRTHASKWAIWEVLERARELGGVPQVGSEM
jgi:hypothetical protein